MRRQLFRLLLMLAIAFRLGAVEAGAPKLSLAFAGSERLPQVVVDGTPAIIHTQGLFVSARHLLITGRHESDPTRACLVRIRRDNERAVEYLDITPAEPTEHHLDHPGGFDVTAHGEFWIPISTSHRQGPTQVVRYKIGDDGPLTSLTPTASFSVDDHLGAVACLGDGTLLAANWDTQTMSRWSATGAQLPMNETGTTRSPSDHLAIQDWKHASGKAGIPNRRGLIMAGGLIKSAGKSIAAVQLLELSQDRMIVLQSILLDRPTNVARPVTNEGLALYGNELYLLPEDLGRGAKLLRYDIVRSP